MTRKPIRPNPAVLRWARERVGLSLAEVGHSIGQPPSVVAAWESGEAFPTYVQLESLAYKQYKRPLAVFFFPSPPTEVEPAAEFRLIPAAELQQLESDTLLAIRQAHSMQESLRELTDNQNPATPRLLVAVRPERYASSADLCEAVREILGLPLDVQLRWGNPTEAFKHWREAVESRGVYVFKRSFKQVAVSGFSLQDSEFPVIFINNSTPHSRQIFTLFHELAHLLYGTSGMTIEGVASVDHLSERDKRAELACNRFAGEFLVPDRDFDRRVAPQGVSEPDVEHLARLYSVSREVILRKLLDRRIVDSSTYARWTDRWNAEFQRKREKSGGGNYYATQATYLGPTFLQLAFSRFHEGRIGLPELAGHLAMKARLIPRFEAYLTGGPES